MACGATLKRSLEFDPLHSPQATPMKRRRCMPITMAHSAPPTKLHQITPSPFTDVSSKLSREEITARIGSELKRMQRRKQLFYPASISPPLPAGSPMNRDSLDALTIASTSSPLSVDFSTSSQLSPSGSSSPRQKDVPLFTFKQVAMICERMVQEHEDKIREDYDKVLNSKLSEQYEAFLKFNHDQLQKRFGNTPMSYVS